jgi:hypothetical protein
VRVEGDPVGRGKVADDDSADVLSGDLGKAHVMARGEPCLWGELGQYL